MKSRVKFTVPTALVREPIIYLLGKDYSVITNIRRADVGDVQGWVILELEGDEQDIENGLKWVQDRGVRVDPVGGDVVAG